MGTIRVIDSYMVPAFHIRYGGTIRVIDSYKVPTVDSNHIVHKGGWHVLAPNDWGLYWYFIEIHRDAQYETHRSSIWQNCCWPTATSRLSQFGRTADRPTPSLMFGQFVRTAEWQNCLQSLFLWNLWPFN